MTATMKAVTAPAASVVATGASSFMRPPEALSDVIADAEGSSQRECEEGRHGEVVGNGGHYAGRSDQYADDDEPEVVVVDQPSRVPRVVGWERRDLTTAVRYARSIGFSPPRYGCHRSGFAARMAINTRNATTKAISMTAM